MDLDQAVLRLGFDYGLTDRLTIGIGRSSQEKTDDGSVKYRAIRQTTGAAAMPVPVTLFASSAITTLKFNELPGEKQRTTASRMTYACQALIARKFSPNLSGRLMPTLVHRSYVATPTEQNDVYALDGGLRQKTTKRTALTADYYYLFPGHTADYFRNALGWGLIWRRAATFSSCTWPTRWA